MIRRTLLVPALLALAACSSTPTDVKNTAHGEQKPASQASIEAKQVAAEQEAPYVTEISFKKGSKDLTKASQEKIEALMKRASQDKEVKTVKVVSWADQEYPGDEKKTLPKDQKELAKNRNEEIKNFLERAKSDLKVETYSMAERPSALNDFLGTDGARIKESLEKTGIATTDKQNAMTTSKASKAMVMLVLKDEKK